MPMPSGEQWVLDAAEASPEIPLVRAEVVTIDADEEEEDGERPGFSEYMAQRGIAPLTIQTAE